MRSLRTLLAAGVLAIAGLATPLAARQARAADPIVVFAAASLKGALDGAVALYEAEGGAPVTVSYAGSSALARQIESGAPADVFISADLDWMKYLAGKSLVRAGTERRLLGNRLVLIAPKDGARAVEIGPGFALAAALGDGRLVLCDLAVPCGKYGKAALEGLGVWGSVEGRIAFAENVRAALAFVSRGEAPYGIVYATDAAADPAVAVVGTFPEDSHPPIVYPVAVTAESQNPAAAAFVEFLATPKAGAVFEKAGFTVLGERAGTN
ncbi:molybdate ABC transporter substrate-binding protein [Pseudoxanthobacter sp. M-2]|uniref:molybdate ABC transporter substrate-binding protein n=1 Tax=Pseudoxanthobacter sp. M-2 TaxID=3078754 RepID=UPI0038FCFB0F